MYCLPVLLYLVPRTLFLRVLGARVSTRHLWCRNKPRNARPRRELLAKHGLAEGNRIMRTFVFATTTICVAAATALGAEWPDPNPAPNSDGTNTWYVGNNTQYPIIQEVLDACGDGDEIVVAGGLYVESLSIDNSDVTIRPFCEGGDWASGSPATWAEVVFWNPTEGFENDNEYAMYMTGGNNTYVGRPRQLTQLPNTNVVLTMVTPGEWEPTGDPVAVTDVYGTCQNEAAMEFWSRSIDNVAVYSDNGEGTFQNCFFTSSDGFGGGAMITGAGNTTQFIECDFEDTFAGGQSFGPNGEPVCVITIRNGEPQFHDCSVSYNEGGAAGIVNQVGGGGMWYYCGMEDNWCASGEGTFNCAGGTPDFLECWFYDNHSREGTVYFDSSGVDGARFMNFVYCDWYGNSTSGDQYGGAIQVVCDDCSGNAPQISLSECGFDNNNGNSGLGLYDIDSPYFPEYRIAYDINTTGLALASHGDSGIAGDVNSDGAIDTNDLDDLFQMLGTCSHDSDYSGDVQIGDLLNLISVYGNSCN